MVPLSNKWTTSILKQPETGMDYQIVTITTKDGRKFPQTIISGGMVTQVRGYQEIPFSESDIIDIDVTNEKWDWTAERSS